MHGALLSCHKTLKSCELDPLPASFLTHCLDDLLPHLTSITNDCLHSGLFPSAFKSAIVKPLLKKTTLNPEILTTDQRQTSPSCPKSLRKLFSASSRTIFWPTISSILISQLTVPVIAPRQPSQDRQWPSLCSRWRQSLSPVSAWSICCLWYCWPLHSSVTS